MPCSDNTTFPAAAASQIGQAFLSRNFSRALVYPICDLVCFGNFKLGGGDSPAPTPPVPVTKMTASAPVSDEDVERIGHMLNSAAEMHGRLVKGSHDLLMPLPWSTILSVLVTILQGILLGSEPAPVNPAQD